MSLHFRHITLPTCTTPPAAVIAAGFVAAPVPATAAAPTPAVVKKFFAFVDRVITLPKAPDPVEQPVQVRQDLVADEPTTGEVIDWRNPKVVKLFVLAGKAEIILTHTKTGARFTYVIKQSKGSSRTAECAYYVDLDNGSEVGRIDADDDFQAKYWKSKVNMKTAADLFAIWWSTLSAGTLPPASTPATPEPAAAAAAN